MDELKEMDSEENSTLPCRSFKSFKLEQTTFKKSKFAHMEADMESELSDDLNQSNFIEYDSNNHVKKVIGTLNSHKEVDPQDETVSPSLSLSMLGKRQFDGTTPSNDTEKE